VLKAPDFVAGYNKGLPVISGISVNDGNSASANYSRIDVSASSQLSLFDTGRMRQVLTVDTVTSPQVACRVLR